MLVLIPIIVFVLLWILAYQRGASWRPAFLSAALVYGVLLLVLTETLSLFHVFTPTSVAIGWGLIGIGAARQLSCTPSRLRSEHREHLTVFLWLLLGATGVIVLIVAVTGFISPPNNWDSMTYHMARVVHWIQNQSVEHYPTSIARQLYQHPWAEYAIAHLQLLSGGDRFANLVQWFALVGSTIGVSLIAQKLGASLRGQIFAAILCATLPMAVLQGSSTQNDLVLAFWVMCVAYSVLNSAQEGLTRQNILSVGAATGLALATKATAYVYLLPFGVWFAVLLLRQFKLFWKYAIVTMALIVALNVSHLARNYNVYGSLTGPETSMYTNEVMSPAYFISNIVRNISLHIAVPASMEGRLQMSRRLTASVQGIHDFLGISIEDPRTTIWYQGVEYTFFSFSLDEDSTSAPVQLLLILIAICVYVVRNHASSGLRSAMPYGIVVLAGFFLFCLILKWQPWHNRLHLPLFVLSAAFTGYILAKGLPTFIGNMLIIVPLIFVVFPLFQNSTRPLDGQRTIFNTDRWTLYFMKRPEIQTVYTHALETIHESGCSDVGLYFSGDVWEYPLWVYTREHEDIIRFEHVNTLYLHSDIQPCAIIRDDVVSTDAELTLNGQQFVVIWSEAPLSILFPQPAS